MARQMSEHQEDKTEFPKKEEPAFDWDSVGMDFGDWDEKKVWALEEPITEIDRKELLWSFDVPFWQKDDAARWTLTPWDVIHKASGSESEQRRVAEADLSYPVDIMENKGRWFVLDGLHRLAKAYQQGQEKIRVRIIPRARLPEIRK